ncbi:MAG TPA: hypothetical protein VGU66_11390 [Candidatus Elarobacter sp.]|nr:hypothetical protein [Candidatus Elarobacter sp.]
MRFVRDPVGVAHRSARSVFVYLQDAVSKSARYQMRPRSRAEFRAQEPDVDLDRRFTPFDLYRNFFALEPERNVPQNRQLDRGQVDITRLHAAPTPVYAEHQ